ncbi:MAG: O-antigen ligase family protein [Candidatus Omnitrophota bacterium]
MLETGLYLFLILAAYFFLFFFYSSIMVRAHWFLAAIPLACVFTGFPFGGLGGASPEKTYVLLLLPGLLYLVFFKQGLSQSRRGGIPRTITFTFLLFWLILLAAQSVNAGGVPSFSTLSYLLGLLGKGLLVFFIVRIIDRKSMLDLCIKSIIVSTVAIQILAFTEILISGDFFVLRNNAYNLNLAVSNLTTLPDPTLMARNLVVVFNFAVFGAFYFRKTPFFKWLSIIQIVGSAMLILASLSRTGLITFLMEVFIILFFRKEEILKNLSFSFTAVISTVVLIGVFFWSKLTERFINMWKLLSSPMEARSFMGISLRMKSWMAGIGIIVDHPFFGVKMDDLEQILTKYGSISLTGPEQMLRVHSTQGSILKFMVKGGVFAGMTFLLLACFYMKFLVNRLRQTRNDTHKLFIQTAIAQAVATLVFSFSTDAYFLNIFWFSAGIIFAGDIIFSNHMEDKKAVKI